MTDYSTVAWHVRFLSHPGNKEHHRNLNTLYSDFLPDAALATLFTDNTRQQLVANVADVLRNHIISMIEPFALETTDKTVIRTIIMAAPLSVGLPNTEDSHCRRIPTGLESTMQRALATAGTDDPVISIRIGLNHVTFANAAHSLSYLDWEAFYLNTSPDAQAQRAAAATAANAPAANSFNATELAQALATALPTTPSATDIAIAFRNTFSPTGSPSPATASTSATSVPSPTLFNYNSLPADVKRRYTAKLDERVLTGTLIATKFTPVPGSNMSTSYHQHDADKIILADGTLFVLQELNTKGLLRAQVQCSDTTPQGIRAWYNIFSQACFDHGFYCHPLWCYRKDHGGQHGFTIGDTTDDDLPSTVQLRINNMKHPLFRVLNQTGMFPTNCAISRLLPTCGGDGYTALKSILLHSQAHPAFVEMDGPMVSAAPTQGSLSFPEYYNVFKDYLMLRAYIHDEPYQISDKKQLDTFLTNAKDSLYLINCTRDERKTPSLAHKYKGTQLLDTLLMFLNARPSSAPAPASGSRTWSRRAPTGRANNLEPLLEAPSDLPDLTLPELAAFALRSDSSRSSQTCVVCQYLKLPETQHVFAQCPVLTNQKYLQTHYIRLCQMLNRDQSLRQNLLPPASATNPPPTTTVNALDPQLDATDPSAAVPPDASPPASSDSDPTHPPGSESDFLPGHR